jgi:parallel beta-helix repeat protein
LVNAEFSSITGNIVYDNAAYGVDMGGCNNVTMTGNAIHNNGLTASLPATDLNCGGSKNCVVAHNTIYCKGGVNSKAIYASGFESNGSGLNFDQVCENLIISGNQVTLGAPGGIGVYVNHGTDRVSVTGNQVSGAANINESFVLEMGTGFNRYRNDDNIDLSNPANIASASTLIIPDTGDAFRVTGSVGITNIRTYSDNAYQGRVRHVYISNGGTGYSPTSPPTVSFTGGGGSGAAGTALVSNSGAVIGVQMTTFGSGYTSAPSVSFSGGGGSGAAGTALTGCDNFTRRVITLLFDSGLTVTDGGNLKLNGNLVAGTDTTLTLRGQFGNWYEIGRSIN